MSGRSWRVVAASVLVAALTGPVGARPATASSTRVVVAHLQFTPARLQVSVGDVVVWEVEDDGHTVTARDGTFDSSDRGLMSYGDEFRWRFTTPGTYPYFCRVHANRGMQGVIMVVDPNAPSTTTATSTRPVPVSAAATTTTLGDTTSTTAPATTTTTRPLATSSTTSVAMATPSTTLVGAPADPQAPPALNPAAPVLGSGSGLDQGLPASDAASHRSSGRSGAVPVVGAVAGALVVLGGVGGGLRRRARRRRTG